jgi:hypothetical protein
VDRAVCALSFIRVVRLLILISQSADPAGAEACRYSENRRFFLRLLSLFAATVLFESL